MENEAVNKDSVVSIISHGHGAILANLLNDIQNVGIAHQARVIVTLNIPEPEAIRTEEWKFVEWIHNQNPKGFGANHNAALKDAVENYHIILNPDIRLTENPLPQLIETLNNHPDIGLIAPKIVNGMKELEDSARLIPTPWNVGVRGIKRLLKTAPSVNPPAQPDWLAGMFYVITKEAFTRVQGFDQRFYLYCEDIDICLRLQNIDIGIFLDSRISVQHDAQRTSSRSLTYLMMHLYSLFRLWAAASFWQFLKRKRNVLRNVQGSK